MISLQTAAGFIAIAMALTLMPGPDIVFVVAQSMNRSARSGIWVALGLCTGLLVHTSLAALGVSAIVLSSQAAFASVKWLGALYLLYLAWRTWPRNKPLTSSAGAIGRSRADAGDEQPNAPARVHGNGWSDGSHANNEHSDRLTPAMLYRRGIWMNVLNPKVSLFFLALLPQFVDTTSGYVPLQMIELGLLFIVQALLVFSAASIASGWLGAAIQRRSSKWNKRLSIIEALIYAALAANLVLLHV